jgi:PhoH-like ATPase
MTTNGNESHVMPVKELSTEMRQRARRGLNKGSVSEAKPRKVKPKAPPPKGTVKKMFVLDTNVIMHDPSCFYRFEEHDVFIPMMTLEELDNNKKGQLEKNRNARTASRILDELTGNFPGDIRDGMPLFSDQNKTAKGLLYLQMESVSNTVLSSSFAGNKADNEILAVAKHLQNEHHREYLVVVVSKDINVRIKARSLEIPAEDYYNDKVLEDTDILYTGTCALPSDFWEKHEKVLESWKREEHTHYRVHDVSANQFFPNQGLYFEEEDPSTLFRVVNVAPHVVEFATLTDYTSLKHSVWGITARNREQNFALNLLMDPNVDFVTLLGQAGTGKTLLTLAAGLIQVLETKLYSEIIMTRVTVPVGEDIGFLPGNEEEKMAPWMGALEDNLEVLAHVDAGSGPYGGEWGQAATCDIIRQKIRVKSLNFMRGRTFLKKFLIIDEAQNLTPKQMKTLVTRAGPGTKVVCLGNLSQIDTPYLSEGSSGLTYVVDRFKDWQFSGHVTLQRGERSRLADHAAEVL